MAQEWNQNLTEADFTLAAPTLNSTSYQEVAYYQVPYRQEVYAGYGSLVLGNDTRGTFKSTIQTSASADLTGTVAIVLVDANRLNSKVLRRDLASDAKTGVKVGKGGQTGLEAGLPFVREREFVSIQAQTKTGTHAVDSTKTTLTVPVTIRAI